MKKVFQRSMILATLVGLSLGPSVQANQANNLSFRQLVDRFAHGFVPPEDGAPKKTTTAGSRDEARCRGDNQAMRPLLPPGNYGLTAAAHPILFMEIPETQAEEVLLVFQTETGDYHSETILPISAVNDQGLVQFQPPENTAGLAIDQTYKWTISILCSGRLDPSNPFFSGWIKRIQADTDVTQALGNESMIEQINQLQETGYWYDMLPLILAHQDQL